MSRMSRSAHGLDTAAEVDWRVQGACAQGDWPANWWTHGDIDPSPRRWAIWVCWTECPVRRACQAWAEAHPALADQAVYGGAWWTRDRNDGGNRRGTPRPSAFYRPAPPPPQGMRLTAVSRPLPCGTRAAAQRHRQNGEPVCPPCVQAERAYDQAHPRRARRPVGEVA